MIRRYGRSPERGQRYQTRHGAYAVLLRGSDILLTWQEEPHFELQLPGGGIDPGESAVAALHREVLEETGWRISSPRKLGVFRRFAYMPEYDLWAEKICHVFLARPTICQGPPTEAGHTAVWSSPERAAGLVYNSGDSHFILSAARQRLKLRK